jgi:predicted negative regulator of RcsB-dependent stress response
MEGKDDEPQQGSKKWRVVIRNIVAVAASLLLIFILIEAYKFYRLSPGGLFEENYTAYELTVNDSIETQIERSYREKKYAEVIKLNANSVVSIKDIFLTGISYLETGDASKAITNFQVVLVDVAGKKSELKDPTEYYLALAYVKNTDYDQAIELMNAIHNDPAHQYKGKFSRRYINRVKRLKWR